MEIPAKAHIYAAVLGLINAGDHAMCTTLLDYIVDLWPKTIAEGNVFRLRSLVRFLVLLAPARVIDSNDALNVLQLLVTAAMAGVPTDGGDSIVSAVLSALPWIGQIAHQNHREDLKSLLDDLETYLSRRTGNQASALRVFQDAVEATTGTTDTAEIIIESWSRIRQLAAADWQLPFLPKTFQTLASKLDAGMSVRLFYFSDATPE